MSPEPKRNYKSDLRAAQAEATRQAILAATRRVCRARGWPQATFPAIAKEAGVSKETVYAIFKSKVALIGEAVRTSVAEATPGRHFLDEERPRAISAEADPGKQIDMWAIYLTEILERVAPLMAVVRTAAEAEPEMADLYRGLHDGRRANLRLVAESIGRRGKLKAGMGTKAAAEALWQLASPEMFTLLTGLADYSPLAYGKWLAGMLRAALLER